VRGGNTKVLRKKKPAVEQRGRCLTERGTGNQHRTKKRTNKWRGGKILGMKRGSRKEGAKKLKVKS